MSVSPSVGMKHGDSKRMTFFLRKCIFHIFTKICRLIPIWSKWEKKLRKPYVLPIGLLKCLVIIRQKFPCEVRLETEGELQDFNMKIQHVRYLAEVSLRIECKKKIGCKIKRKLTVCVLHNMERHSFKGRIFNVFIKNSQNLKLGKTTDRRCQKC